LLFRRKQDIAAWLHRIDRISANVADTSNAF